MITTTIKVYFPRSIEPKTLQSYQEIPLEEAKPLLEKALFDQRILVNVLTSQRVTLSKDVKNGDIIRVFPLVGGG